VLGRQLLRRRWHHLLHDHSSESIGDRLAYVAGVLPIFVSVLAA
jgi:hypothetical protein